MPAVNSQSNATSHDVVSIRLQLETNLKAKGHLGGGGVGGNVGGTDVMVQ